MYEHKYPNAEQLVENYINYIQCFREKNFEVLKEYVAEDVYFYWGMDMPSLKGRNEFFNFFKEAWKYFDENPVESEIEVNIPIVRARIDNKLTVHNNWDNDKNPFMGYGFEIKAGEVHDTSGYVSYVFNEDGKIAIIVSNAW